MAVSIPHLMLYLHLNKEQEKPFICMETQPYYKDQNRQIHTEEKYDELTFSTHEEYSAFIWEIGWKIALGLFIRNQPDLYSKQWCQIAYLYHRHHRPVLRIDEEPCRHNAQRIFCQTFPLPTANADLILSDNETLKKVGHTVVKILGLEFGKEPKMLLER